MSQHYPYTDEEIQAFKDERRFSKCLQQFHWYRMQLRLAQDSKHHDNEFVVSRLLYCHLLFMEMMELDSVRTQREIPDIYD